MNLNLIFNLFVKVLIINCLLTFYNVGCLECYVCKNQENNKDKCVETVRTCDLTEDRCLSEVRWGSTPYWAPTGEKQFYVSKRCASKKLCENAMRNVTKRCDRIWYNDWECVECCNGDRCNYYITLASNHLIPGYVTIFVTLFLALFLIQ
ncbi:uncharacterized protein LOC128965449 [Oppia nitens]|uniref:uncharacterized protein LOC128965449 n=1 Tax=Oppia nitens TaxID=1686743 RepID=UPI0023DC84A0|nr:uncharacterized protein LOC128965449 [Oppia nitens]